MKTLQNNFTTPEQSKLLMELGVPVDSADCCLDGSTVIMLNGKTFQESYNEDLDLARLHLIEYPHYIPCWSVGRLMAIYFISKGLNLWSPQFKKYQIENSAEYFVALIGENIKDLDFSKLED